MLASPNAAASDDRGFSESPKGALHPDSNSSQRLEGVTQQRGRLSVVLVALVLDQRTDRCACDRVMTGDVPGRSTRQSAGKNAVMFSGSASRRLGCGRRRIRHRRSRRSILRRV